jgi:NADH-quinone oxidoreductase subunit N
MTLTDLRALLPILVLAASVVAALLVIAIRRSQIATVGLTLGGLTLAFVSLFAASPAAPRQVTSLLRMDGYALFYIGLLLATAFVVAVLSYGYLRDQRHPREEFYVLLLMATLGSAVLVCSSHFASFFLGLEILSVALYALIAYLRDRKLCIEAGLKYLVLAAASAAFLLFGIALIYADLGTMAFDQLAAVSNAQAGVDSLFLPAGLAMVVVGLGFKLGLVPFHLWTPDVYEGAPAPVTAFVATASKGAVFALLLRLFQAIGGAANGPLAVAFSLIALASMFAGNLLALSQSNLKRILAYSSIAHLGYLLVALMAGGSLGMQAATFYLVAYVITTLTAFGVVTILSGSEKDADALEDYRGLFWRRPWPAAVLTASLFSLAGLPLTAGFLAKLNLLAVGVGSRLWLLAIGLVVSSALGLYYYLRIIVTMYQQPEAAAIAETEPAASRPSLPLAGGLVLGVLTLLLVLVGVYPVPLLDLIRAALAGLV